MSLPDPTKCRTPFVATLSPRLRKAAAALDINLQVQAAAVAQAIADAPGVLPSLMVKPPEGGRYSRQMDLSVAPGEPVILKSFTEWSEHHGCLHVLLELADESYWEDDRRHESN